MLDPQQTTPATPESVISPAQHYAMTKSVKTIVADLASATHWLHLAAFAAFVASSIFVVKYMAGGNLAPSTWDGETWINAAIGIGITGVITAMQMKLYASGRTGAAAIIATFMVVFFGLFSEISQSMEREDHTVRSRSEDSAVYKAAVSAIGTASTQAPTLSGSTTRTVQRAQGEVGKYQAQLDSKNACNSCVKRKFREIRADLIAAQTKFAEAKAGADMEIQAGAAASGAAVTNAIQQAKLLQTDENNHYAIIRLMKSLFAVSALWASFIFSTIIIGIFEYAFHWMGSYVGHHKEALKMIGRGEAGEKLKPEAMAAEEIIIPTTPEKIIPVPVMPTKQEIKKPTAVVEIKPENTPNKTGGHSVSPTVHPAFHNAANAYGQFMDKVKLNTQPMSTSPSATLSGGATAPANFAIGNLALSGNAALAQEIQIDLEEQVNPGKMNKPSLDLVVNNIPSSEANNPAEKTLLKTLSTGSDNPVDRVKEQGSDNPAGDPDTNPVEYTSADFLAVLKAIDLGMKRFSLTSVGNVLKEECGMHGDSQGIRLKVELLADGFTKEGVVIPNPKFAYDDEGNSNGVGKWLINPEYKRQPEIWKNK